MTDFDNLKTLADQLWLYFKPKIARMNALNVKFFRAQVVSNPGGNKLEVKRSNLDETTITLPCTNAMSSAAVGSQVIVFALGDLSNAVVVSDGKMTAL